MTTLVNRDNAPTHLFNIPELDFSEDLFSDPLGSMWFRLGVRTIKSHRSEKGVEDFIERQSFLLAPECFTMIFDRLVSIGNVIGDLGKPKSSVLQEGDHKKYSYAPFHKFEFAFTSIVGEPLVSIHHDSSDTRFFVNPDLSLYFELEEKSRGIGIWWDPRRGVEVLRQRVVDQDNLEIVELQIDYLLKYLQMRQTSLVVGHYRHLHLFDPPPNAIGMFVEGDLTLGSPEQGTKAFLQNWGLRKDIPGNTPFLQRRLHLWFQIKPPSIDVEDPWTEPPPFDPYTFTLPTLIGPVAPARWKHFRQIDGIKFDGGVCDFLSPVYFRQEVLTKYQGTSGFEIGDDGSVSCRHYWGLVRSTRRLGNELLSTAIGDFAEGVPFEEWPHWKQYAVHPPSLETANTLREEQTVPDAVNLMVRTLSELNAAFKEMATSFDIAFSDMLWQGSLDSLAARQLKWVYPTAADDDEFLKRATLASTLVIDGLKPSLLRKLLCAMGKNLHKSIEKPRQTLGSRTLLQRLTLIAILMKDLRPKIAELPRLIKQAEGKATNEDQPDLQAELTKLYQHVRQDFAPLAFLYDLRIHGGLAHPPNKARAAEAAKKLGLPEKSWHRTDYLRLLNLITDSIHRISRHLERAALMPSYKGT
jgi:hypothetical protein